MRKPAHDRRKRTEIATDRLRPRPPDRLDVIRRKKRGQTAQHVLMIQQVHHVRQVAP
jgi:hypothetical protein